MIATKNKKIGNLGEELAVIFLKKKNHKILKRNWEKAKIGEIDIISQKDGVYYFTEVKTTTNDKKKYSPLDHLDKEKIRKFQKIVNYYLIENNLIEEDFQLAAILVYLQPDTKKAKINFIENIY
jgi:putative endonuclease